MSEISHSTESYIQNNSDDLVNTIVSLVASLKADYPEQFKRAYPENDSASFDDPSMNSLRMLKRRLYKLLKGFPVRCIVSGYENCIAKHAEFLPSIPAIMAEIAESYAKFKKSENNRIEADHVAALPAPAEVKPQPERVNALMRDAMKTPQTDEAERLKRLAEKLQMHEALIAADKARGLIEKGPDWNSHSCAVGFCGNAGVLAHGKGGNFYCATHFFNG